MKRITINKILMASTICLSLLLISSTFVEQSSNESLGIELKKDARRTKFLSQWETSKEYTLELIEAMPAKDFDFKPVDVDTVRTFAQQVKHMGAIIYGINSIFLLDQDPVAPDPEFENKGLSKKEIKSFMTSAFDMLTTTVEGMTEKQLYEERAMFFMPNKPMLTKFEYLDFIRDHNTHHRGQIVTYLRANGIAPPAYKYISLTK